MPCSPGMRGCHQLCAHRRFVLDYVAERDAQERRAEGAARGDRPEEIAEYFGATGRPIEHRWTFRRWLKAYSGADYPYPSPGRKSPPHPFLDDVDEMSTAV